MDTKTGTGLCRVIIIVLLVLLVLISMMAFMKKEKYQVENPPMTAIGSDVFRIGADGLDTENCGGEYDECVTYADHICQTCMNNYGRDDSCSMQCALRDSCRDNLEACKTVRGQMLQLFDPKVYQPYPLQTWSGI